MGRKDSGGILKKDFENRGIESATYLKKETYSRATEPQKIREFEIESLFRHYYFSFFVSALPLPLLHNHSFFLKPSILLHHSQAAPSTAYSLYKGSLTCLNLIFCSVLFDFSFLGLELNVHLLL